MVFADNMDLTFDARYIVVREGSLIAGNECLPYRHNLTFTMFGNLKDV